MRRWETLTALAAVVFASVGSIPHVPFRAAITVGAIVLIAIVGISRLVATLSRRTKPLTPFDPAQRAKSIREARSKKR